MTEPQSWTLIATFTTAIFGMLTLFALMLTRVIKTEIGGLRGDMVALEARLSAKVDALDRDVQAIARRVLPDVE